MRTILARPVLLIAAVGLAGTAVAQVRVKSQPQQARPPAAQPGAARTAASSVARLAEWSARVQETWLRIGRIPVDVEATILDATPRWLKAGEDGHAYKIERDDGSIDYADAAPTDDGGIRALFQRTSPGYQIIEAGARDRIHSWVWVRMSFVEEESKWVRGSDLDHRFRREDRFYREWRSRVFAGPITNATALSTRARALVRSMASVDTARETVERLRTGSLRAAQGDSVTRLARATADLERREENFKAERESMQRVLLVAGEKLGAGDRLWECERLALEIAAESWRCRAALGRRNQLESRARHRPELADEMRVAQDEWQHEVRRQVELRRQRRSAMADVMQAAVTPAAASSR